MKKCIKFIVLVTVLIVAASALIGCGKSDDEINAEVTSAFTEIMETFRSGSAQDIEKYADLGSDPELSAALAASLANIEYSVKSVSASGSTATVNAEITSPDASQIMQKYVAGVAALVSSSDYQSNVATMTKEEYDVLMNSQLISVLQSGEIPDITEGVSVEMVKKDGKWQLKDSSLSDKLVGNTLNAVNQIKQ